MHALLPLLLLIAVLPATARDVAAVLARELAVHANHPRFQRAHLGIKVITIPGDQTVFDHQSEKLFKPASNAKLFTGALVLDRFEPEYRIQTSCYTTGGPDANGLVPGNLIIYGRGDPSFSPRFHRGDLTAPFRAFAKAIHEAGVRQVKGNIVADESYFHIPPFGSGWTWDDLLESYGTEISALSANDNIAHLNLLPGTRVSQPTRISTRPSQIPFLIRNHSFTGRPGSGETLADHRPFLKNELILTGQLPADHAGRHYELTIRRPAAWFGQLLKIELEKLDIQIDGQVEAFNWNERLLRPLSRQNLKHVASIPSPSLLELTRHMMKDSQNLHAQLLLLQAGMKSPQAGMNTEKSAIADLDRFIRTAGIAREEVNLEEGSGLSRRALTTPNSIVRLLIHMARHPRSKEFTSTLTVAGRDGTLGGRMKGSSAENNLRGKTGSLNGIKALSGYVTNRARQKFAFSILLNHHPQSGSAARMAIENIAITIANSNVKID
jgi:serine-type D-Ala-D-Ala carboxypeptidase/endopeptidase (penicillin-binding protein 4)